MPYLWTNFQCHCKFVQMNDSEFINRELATEIKKLFDFYAVITLTGPRQSGKTTLCRKLFPELPYVNLEDADTLLRIREDTKGFLANFPHGMIIDEAHHFPQLFSALQVIVDEDRFQGDPKRKFIVTGSSNFALLEKVSQSMAGRTAVLTLLPLSIQELHRAGKSLATDQLILNGGYPAVWLREPMRGRIFRDYTTTYIERDVRSILNVKDLMSFQNFIRLCAGRIGTEFNASALSVAIGVSVNTISSWLSVLAASYVVYLLPPYHANIGKRLTKTPKLYFYDTGLAAHLLGIENEQQLQTHPLRGALFENMVINEMLKEGFNRGEEERLYFYRDKTQREVDVLRTVGLEIEAFEIKAGKSYNPDYFKHLKFLQELLGPTVKRSAVIYDGDTLSRSRLNGVYNFRDFQFSDSNLLEQ